MFLLLLKSSYFLYKVEVKIISSIDIQGLNANNLVKKNILRVNRNKLRVGRKYKILLKGIFEISLLFLSDKFDCIIAVSLYLIKFSSPFYDYLNWWVLDNRRSISPMFM